MFQRRLVTVVKSHGVLCVALVSYQEFALFVSNDGYVSTCTVLRPTKAMLDGRAR